MKKTSRWRRLCCACGTTDDDSMPERPYDRPQRRPRSKNAGHTWTRRSLLENDQVDENYQVPLRSMAYQMRAIETPTNIPTSTEDDDEFTSKELKRLVAKSRNQKRRSNDILLKTSTNSSTAADTLTTFPWMDETFTASSVRSGMRLGVSSLHLTRRTSTDIRTLGDISQFFANYESQSNTSAPNKPSNQAAVIKVPDLSRNSKVISENSENRNSAFNRVNAVPYAEGTDIYDASKSPTSAIQRPFVPRTSVTSSISGTPGSDKYYLFKTPTENDLGYSQNFTKTPHKETYPGIQPFTVGHDEVQPNIKVRPSIMDIFPVAESRESKPMHIDDAQSGDFNFSFASEITFHKAQNIIPEFSVPRPVKSNSKKDTSTYSKRVKNKISKYNTTNQKGSVKSDVTPRVESLYGYVPKAVMDVSASNALEGSAIDDFFKMKATLNERTCLRSLPYVEDGKIIALSSESDSDNDDKLPDMTSLPEDKPYVISVVLDSDDDNDEKTENMLNSTTNGESNQQETPLADQPVTAYQSTSGKGNCDEAINGMLDKLKIDMAPRPTTLNIHGKPILEKRVPQQTFSDVGGCTYTNGRPQQNGFINKMAHNKTIPTDANEDKVIMIDFPPNLETDTTHTPLPRAWSDIAPRPKYMLPHKEPEILY